MRVWSRSEKWGMQYASLALLLAMGMTGCQRSTAARFRITMPKSLHGTPVDGRMLVIVSKDPSREPRLQVTNNALTSQQLFGVNVDGLMPDGSVVIDDTVLGYPLDSLPDLPPGGYYVQAVLNLYETFHRADGHVLKLPMDHWEGQ